MLNNVGATIGRPRKNIVYKRTCNARPYTDHLTDKHQFIAKIYAIPENK